MLTHCNTGALATAGYGTALGVIQSAWRGGKVGMSGWTRRGRCFRGRGSPPGSFKQLGIPWLVTDSAAGP